LGLLQNLKASAYYSDIPVVFVSGKQKSDTRILCLEEGAEDFITKPFNPMELSLKVRRILQSKEPVS
jgi:DNA-binding response OmpR family regulator